MAGLRTRLEPAGLETEFRAGGFASDRRVITVLMVVMITFWIVTFPSTFVLRDQPERLYQVWAIRAIVVATAAASLFAVRRVSSPAALDNIVTVWIGVWFAGVASENALLPPRFTSFIAWDVFLAVGVYAAVPLPLIRQVGLAVILSTGDLLVLWAIRSSGDSVDLVDITLAYAAANTVGVFVSREIHGLRRRGFIALREAVAARTDLEVALREVKTLQGIIPICSFCKNIRTSAGDWESIEDYVHAHSDAEFSHGICRTCMPIHYPGYDIV